MEIKDEILYKGIIENVDKWAAKYLKNFTFRLYQKEYIANIVYSIVANDKHVNIVEAPTGSGKSIMIIIAAGVLDYFYDKTSYILCSDLYLWNQYFDAINDYNLKQFGRIKGTYNNYVCEKTCEDFSLAPCRLANIPYRSLFNKDYCENHNWHCALNCEYIMERKRAINAHITVMTYQLYFPCMNDDAVSENMKDSFPPRDVVFCDECHNVPDLCQQFSTIIFDESDFEKFQFLVDFCLDGHFTHNKTKEYYDNFLEDFHNLYCQAQNSEYLDGKSNLNIIKDIKQYLDVLVQLGDSVLQLYEDINMRGTYLSKKEFKALDIARWIDKFNCSIKEYLEFANAYPECVVKTDNKFDNLETHQKEWSENPQVCYKFAKEDILVYNDLLKNQEYTVMFSATIGDKESFDDNIGIKYMEDKNSEFFIIPSTFDFSKSPIYFIPGNKMSRQYINSSFPNNAQIINAILKSPKHINEKGIIHTGSYKNAYDLLNYLDDECKQRVFIYNNSKEKNSILRKYERSKNGVLIGPTLTEGIDFPDDDCRFIIILKIPYPYLGDNLVKAKCSLFPRWYNSETSSAVIQGIGRGNRHINDWSTTYILDGNFENLYIETRNQYPKELVERMHILTNNKS